MKDLLENYAWIVRGSQREKLIKALNKPQTPTQLWKSTKIKPSNISANLKQMVGRGIIMCWFPNAKTGRLYKLTEKGERLVKKIV